VGQGQGPATWPHPALAGPADSPPIRPRVSHPPPQADTKGAAAIQQLEANNAALSAGNARVQQQLAQAGARAADTERLLALANSQLSATMRQLEDSRSAAKAERDELNGQLLDLQLRVEQLRTEQHKVQPAVSALQQSNKVLSRVGPGARLRPSPLAAADVPSCRHPPRLQPRARRPAPTLPPLRRRPRSCRRPTARCPSTSSC
jgi:hypothetical protein